MGAGFLEQAVRQGRRVSGVHDLGEQVVDELLHRDHGPFPDLGDTGRGGWQSTTDGIKKYARDAGLTLREVALGTTTPRHPFIGTAETIADTMQTWLEAGAVDGFMLDCPVLPTGMREFTEEVVPLLVERGLFRAEYEGETLRENLGLGA